jgi:hypothetical protein
MPLAVYIKECELIEDGYMNLCLDSAYDLRVLILSGYNSNQFSGGV